MKILLDTNIIIHREGNFPLNKDVGILFKWLDNLHFTKCIHQITIDEINKMKAGNTREVMNIKLDSYNTLKVQQVLNSRVKSVSDKIDTNNNDKNDTLLLNELFIGTVDFLITEDKKIKTKAELLGISNRVFSIDSFLEKVVAENPGLTDYKVLAVKKELFGNINLDDEFFDSFKEDYPGFDKWFIKKSEEISYICKTDDRIAAFLYLKIEGKDEPYNDISPVFERRKRLKIGTFKVTLNGYKLGERFIKIIFDNAIKNKVDEIYVTIFNKRSDQQRLIYLLEEFGFTEHGIKTNNFGNELVLVKKMEKIFNDQNPKLTYPFFSATRNAYLVPIYPEYHTNLLPDSILNTETPKDFIENEPFRNAISKVYISRSIFRDLHRGDTIIFYRTGGLYKSVISTVGIVENTITNIKNEKEFVDLCRKRSVFSDHELIEHWNYKPHNRPFIVNFLYSYSFPKRIILKQLIEMGVIADINSAPQGFMPIKPELLLSILKETQTDEGIVVN